MTTISDNDKSKVVVGAQAVSPQNSEKQAVVNRAARGAAQTTRSSVEFFFAIEKSEPGQLLSREIYFDKSSPKVDTSNAGLSPSSDSNLNQTATDPESTSNLSTKKVVEEEPNLPTVETNKIDLGIRDIAKGMFAGEDKG